METIEMSARHKELLALFERHFETERANDIAACMETVSDDITYEHPFRPGIDYHLEGQVAVRDYFTRHWGAQPFQKIVVIRSWMLGEDTLAVESETTVGKPGETPRVTTTLAIGSFRDGKLTKEITVSAPWVEVK
jgi:hypothetical protein